MLHAQHLDRAGDERASLAYLEAARSQSAQYRAQQAMHLVERGLELAATSSEEFELNYFRGEILQHLGRVPESIEAYRRCLCIAEDNLQRCRARLGLAAGMRVMDELDEALEALELAEYEATAEDLKPELAQIHHLRGNLYFPMGNIDGCVEQHEIALQYAREVGSRELEALALGGVGDGLYAQGRMRAAHDYFTQCIDVSRRYGLRRIEVAHLNMIGGGGTLHYLNELRAGLKESLSAAEAARKVGHTRGEILAHIGVSIVAFHLGDLGTTRKHADLGLALALDLGARRFVPRCLQAQAKVASAQGQTGDAVRTLEEAVIISRETGIGYVGAAIFGTLALATDDCSTREEALRKGEEILRAGCVGHNYFEFYQEDMQASLNGEDWKRVERYAAALQDFTREEPLPLTDFFIAHGRALAAFGRGQRDDATMQELHRLRDEAERVGLKVATPALDKALSFA